MYHRPNPMHILSALSLAQTTHFQIRLENAPVTVTRITPMIIQGKIHYVSGWWVTSRKDGHLVGPFKTKRARDAFLKQYPEYCIQLGDDK